MNISYVHSISHKCPNDLQYNKSMKLQMGAPKALANLVPVWYGNQPYSLSPFTINKYKVMIVRVWYKGAVIIYGRGWGGANLKTPCTQISYEISYEIT